jgi:hypothetical protein
MPNGKSSGNEEVKIRVAVSQEAEIRRANFAEGRIWKRKRGALGQLDCELREIGVFSSLQLTSPLSLPLGVPTQRSEPPLRDQAHP